MMRSIVSIAVILAFSPLEAPVFAETGEIEGPQAVSQPASTEFQVAFEALQGALRRYRSLADSGGWPQLTKGPTLRPGDEGPRIAVLAERLAVSGDLAREAAGSAQYDETLRIAVRRFQLRHGLEPDALVERATLRALNVPVERRIDQIRVNLQRMRPYLDIGVEDYVLVNIAAFEATLYRDARKLWSTRVIVGAEEDQTPELRSEMTSVVFNPTWWVPHSIASEELLPEIKRDPGFLARGGYALYDRDNQAVDSEAVDWDIYSANNFPFRIMQRPGPDNQLGKVKFIFPNPYSVCMHDTPARSLFASTKRALSHGCIRVDQPMVLAEHLLAAEGWSKAQVTSQTELRETNAVALSQPLPFFVVYWTAVVDQLGEVHFYNDIYDRDTSLLRKIDEEARREKKESGA